MTHGADLEFHNADGRRRSYHQVDLDHALRLLDTFDWSGQIQLARREHLRAPSITMLDSDGDRQVWASAVDTKPLRFLLCQTTISAENRGRSSSGHLLGDVREMMRAFYAGDDAAIHRQIDQMKDPSNGADGSIGVYVAALLIAILCVVIGIAVILVQTS